MATGLRTLNLVNKHKRVAEEFLSAMIKQKVAPKGFSGVMCPRFGDYAHMWQYDNGKLVGSVIISLKNVETVSSKLKAAMKAVDWMAVAKLQEKDDTGTDL
jgi:hypothetical protein